MNRPHRVPAPGSVGAMIAAVGMGVAIWFGWDWYHMPRWSQMEIEQSIELNLALDLSRQPVGAVSLDQQNQMRERLRREIKAEIAKESELPRGFTMAGLLMATFGLAQMMFRSWLARKPNG